MAIKEDRDEDLIFTNRNGSTLELYNDSTNTHDVTTGLDNNYNSYNSKDAAYEDVSNNKEYGTTYEDGAGANSTHEDGANYTNNPPGNYEQETIIMTM